MAQIGTLYGNDVTPAADCYWRNDSETPSFLVFNSLSLGTEVEGATWIMGAKQPTFDWDEQNIPANYER